MPLYLVLIYLFAGIGVIDTLYMVYHRIRGTVTTCPFFGIESCRRVQYAPQSKVFGAPNAVVWLFIYIAVLALAYLHANGAIDFFPLQTVVGIGFAFSLYATYVQAFVLKAFCTWCLISAINFIVLFVSAFFLR